VAELAVEGGAGGDQFSGGRVQTVHVLGETEEEVDVQGRVVGRLKSWEEHVSLELLDGCLGCGGECAEVLEGHPPFDFLTEQR
jgi:hypothetical protein